MTLNRREMLKKTGTLGILALASPDALTSSKGINDKELTDMAKRKFAGQTIRLLYPKGALGNIDVVAKIFTKKTSININLIEGSLDEISSQVLLESKMPQSKKSIDLAIPATFTIPDLAESNSIHSLDELYSKYREKKVDKDHLYQLGNFYKGLCYGQQTDGDTYLLFLRKSWIANPDNQKKYYQRHGNQLAIPTTWPELDRQIKFFSQKDGTANGGLLFRNKNYTVWEFWARLHGKGILPVDDNFSSQLHSRKSIEALQDLVATTKYLDKSVRTNSLFENFQKFSKGESYCNLGWGGTQKYLMENAQDLANDLVFAALPGGKGFQVPYFNWGWNYVVCKNSSNPEAAFLFSLFATGEKMSTLAVSESSGYFDPFRVCHYENLKIQKIYGKRFLDIHKKSLKESIPDFYVKGRSLYFAALKVAIEAAVEGFLSPKDALVMASNKWDTLTAKLGRDIQMKQWQFLIKSYPRKVRKALNK